MTTYFPVPQCLVTQQLRRKHDVSSLVSGTSLMLHFGYISYRVQYLDKKKEPFEDSNMYFTIATGYAEELRSNTLYLYETRMLWNDGSYSSKFVGTTEVAKPYISGTQGIRTLLTCTEDNTSVTRLHAGCWIQAMHTTIVNTLIVQNHVLGASWIWK